MLYLHEYILLLNVSHHWKKWMTDEIDVYVTLFYINFLELEGYVTNN